MRGEALDRARAGPARERALLYLNSRAPGAALHSAAHEEAPRWNCTR